MLIELSQIPPEGLDIVLPPGDLDLGNAAELWEGPVSVGAAMHLGRSGRGIVIGGTFDGSVRLICSRCLERFGFHAADRFDLYCEVGPQGPSAGDQRALDDDELDVADSGFRAAPMRINLMIAPNKNPLARAGFFIRPIAEAVAEIRKHANAALGVAPSDEDIALSLKSNFILSELKNQIVHIRQQPSEQG